MAEHLKEEQRLRAAADGRAVLRAQEDERAERFRQTILDLMPDYVFSEQRKDPKPQSSTSQTEAVVSSHKQRYGLWSARALSVLKVRQRGTFPELAKAARELPELGLSALSDSEMEGLRGALHGLAKRVKNPAVRYEKSLDGSGGVFIYTKGADDAK